MATNAERKRAQAIRDGVKGIKQVNIRVPALYDVMLGLLARDLREGLNLQGFVLRDPKTGRVKTVAL